MEKFAHLPSSLRTSDIATGENGTWATLFEEHGIIPDVIRRLPEHILEINRQPIGKVIKTAETVPLDELEQAPKFSWPAQESKLYSLFLLNPDVPSRREAFEAEWQHLTVFNIPDNNIDKGESVIEYSPNYEHQAAKGMQRMVALVFEQTKEIDTGNMVKYYENTQRQGETNRGSFHIKPFVYKTKLKEGAVAGNFFYVSRSNITASSGITTGESSDGEVPQVDTIGIEGARCHTKDDCKTKYLCIDNTCKLSTYKAPKVLEAASVKNISGNDEEELVETEEYSSKEEEIICTTDLECPKSRSKCIDYHCQKECHVDDDCPGGNNCTDDGNCTGSKTGGDKLPEEYESGEDLLDQEEKEVTDAVVTTVETELNTAVTTAPTDVTESDIDVESETFDNDDDDDDEEEDGEGYYDEEKFEEEEYERVGEGDDDVEEEYPGEDEEEAYPGEEDEEESENDEDVKSYEDEEYDDEEENSTLKPEDVTTIVSTIIGSGEGKTESVLSKARELEVEETLEVEADGSISGPEETTTSVEEEQKLTSSKQDEISSFRQKVGVGTTANVLESTKFSEPDNLLGYYKHPKECNHGIVGNCQYLAMWFKEERPNEIRFVIIAKGVNKTSMGFSPTKEFVGSDVVDVTDEMVIQDKHINTKREVLLDDARNLIGAHAEIDDNLLVTTFTKQIETDDTKQDINLGKKGGIYFFIDGPSVGLKRDFVWLPSPIDLSGYYDSRKTEKDKQLFATWPPDEEKDELVFTDNSKTANAKQRKTTRNFRELDTCKQPTSEGSNFLDQSKMSFTSFLTCQNGAATKVECPQNSLFWHVIQCCVPVALFPCKDHCLRLTTPTVDSSHQADYTMDSSSVESFEKEPNDLLMKNTLKFQYYDHY